MAEAPAPRIAELVEDHFAPVYRYALRLSGSPHDAEDLAQHVFLVAQQKIGQLRTAQSARSWLFAVLRNAFLKTLPSGGAPPPAAAGDLDDIPAEIPDDDEIDREQLQQALAELPAEFRLVVLMYYFEDLPYREIAEYLDIPVGTVMSRLSRAKGQLRRRLLRSITPSVPERGAR